MSDLPERIKAWTWWNNQTHAGNWHVDAQGKATEYVRADLFDAVKDECDALVARVKALTEALRFYADDAWIDRPPPQPSPEEVAVFGSNILTLGMPEILYDNGDRARAALQENTDDR